MPSDQVNISSGSTLKFSFSKIDKPLYIHTGADSIKWTYNLNTSSIPTYGGEVIQVLSAFVGPITIGGRTRDNVQQKQIVDWFRQYMIYAGYGGRTEQPILFEYPERGWAFYIQITDLSDFHYDVNEVAIPWQITAEMFLDNRLNALADYTMSTFTDSLFKEHLLEVGFSARDPRTDPTNPVNQLANYQTMGDNFQRLIASYTTGDFKHFGFDILSAPDSQFANTADEIYKSYFGSAYVIGEESANKDSGSSSYGGGENPTSKCGIAHLIAAAFEAKDIPGQLGVAVATVESTLNPDARQPGGDSAVGLFQTFPTGAGGSYGHLTQLRQAFTGTKKVTATYTAQMQADDAASWFHAARGGKTIDDKDDFEKMAAWAQDAQRAGVSYTVESEGKHKLRTAWQEAGKLLKKNCPESEGGGGNLTSSSLSGSGQANLVSDLMKLVNGGKISCQQTHRDQIKNGEIANSLMKAMILIASNGWPFTITALKDGGHSANSAHYSGRGVDIGTVKGELITRETTGTTNFQQFLM